jgi:hypothetical protein
VAAPEKKARGLNATLCFTDESGFLLAPLSRRSIARVGRTPLLTQRASQRDKVSVAAALTLSPAGRVGLHALAFPDAYVDGELYAGFLRHVLGRARGPLLVVHDGGTMHKGEPLRALHLRHPRLGWHFLPPYAPELNPVEHLWNHLKDKELVNFVPADVPQLTGAVCESLAKLRDDHDRLRSFFTATPLFAGNRPLFF